MIGGPPESRAMLAPFNPDAVRPSPRPSGGRTIDLAVRSWPAGAVTTPEIPEERELADGAPARRQSSEAQCGWKAPALLAAATVLAFWGAAAVAAPFLKSLFAMEMGLYARAGSPRGGMPWPWLLGIMAAATFVGPVAGRAAVRRAKGRGAKAACWVIAAVASVPLATLGLWLVVTLALMAAR
jgi:hypothetical protein